MHIKTLLMILGGVFVAGVYTIISVLIRDTQAIWIETRLFGLLAFLMLFLAVLLGELRMLAKDKSKFPLFRYHKPIAIFATFLVLLHFIAAFADNYKWGKQLHLAQYLGFTFSDQWMVLLSFGTLAFYLLLIIGLTSATRGIQLIGFKRWKLIHYTSYACFVIAYIHSVNLGTDLKESVLAPFLQPTIVLMFAVITTLFLVRAINAFPVFEDQAEVNLAVVLVFLTLFFGSLLLSETIAHSNAVAQTEQQLTADENQLVLQESQVASLSVQLANDTLLLGGSHG